MTFLLHGSSSVPRAVERSFDISKSVMSFLPLFFFLTLSLFFSYCYTLICHIVVEMKCNTSRGCDFLVCGEPSSVTCTADKFSFWLRVSLVGNFDGERFGSPERPTVAALVSSARVLCAFTSSGLVQVKSCLPERSTVSLFPTNLSNNSRSLISASKNAGIFFLSEGFLLYYCWWSFYWLIHGII